MRIFSAHAGSSAADAGRHTKSRSRLGVSLTPFTLYGPSTFTVRSRGRPPIMWTSWLSRSAGCHTSCRWNGRSFHVKPTSCGPAVTATRPVMRASISDLRLVHVPGLDLVVLGPADLRGIHLRAVNRDDERVRRVVAFDAGVAFLDAPDQPARQLVLGVGRETRDGSPCRRACRAAGRRCIRSG